MWIIARGDESLILCLVSIEYLEICLQHKFSTPFFQHLCKLKSQERGILLQLQVWGKSCEKNYSSVRRYVADPVNVFPERSITKLILKEAVIFDVKCMGYLVRAYYSISPTSYYKDDSCWSADLKSKTIEDIISIRSFIEVLVLNHYVLVRKILTQSDLDLYLQYKMSGEEPALQMAPVESPQMISTVKLPMLKKGEYTLWSMRMEQYLTNTDYGLWQVIMNGDEPVQTTKDENGVETEVLPKTAQALLRREKEKKDKSILLLAIPDEYQLRFHTIKHAKSLWAAIKSRFGGNVESKKMQKTILKQQFENFFVSDTEGLDKAYDSFDYEKKEGIDELDIDDLYNNLKVFEADIKVCHNSQGQASSSSYTNDLIFSFFANQSSGPQLDDEDLEKIDQDNLEEVDIKWQVAMLSMRVKRFYNKTGRKLIFNGNVEHKKSREQEWRCRNNALIVQDGLGYDWSYIAQDEPTQFALMVYTSNSSVSDTNLGLESVEARQISSKDKTGLGYGDQLNENDSSGSELFNSVFDSRSSDGDDNQTNDRFKKDNGYHVVPPPLTGNYMPPLADLSFAGLDDSVYRPTANKTSASVSQVETSITPPSNTSVEMPRVESVRPSGVIIEDWVSDDDEDIFQSNDLQATDKPSFKKIEFTKARNEPVKFDKQAVKPRMVTQSPKVDRRDWNGKMTQKLGLGFGSTKKACFVCGSYSHLIKDYDFHEKRMAKKSVLKNIGKGTGHREVRPIWNNTQRINHQNKFVPTAVLTRSRRIPVSTAKQHVNTATHKNRVNVSNSKINTFPKSHSHIRRPFYKSTVLNTRVSKEKVNTVRVNGVNIGRQTVVCTVKGNRVTAVKASAGNPQQALKYKEVFDSGCSRNMTGNKALLTDYQDIDGGFVAFGGSTRGCSFTETEYLVLSPDFKLIDESQVLVRVPRQNNMYSFDLKNVVPSEDLTCLFAKATIDESKLWHRRLGHVNFKTINKLVKGNLVRGLPSKTFENDHTCVACQKGKQHKASLTDDFSRSDNGTEFKNREMDEFYGQKGIKREYSVVKTSQQNRVAERKNRTLIEAARTMLADSLLPITPYELIIGRAPSISFMRPFGCPVTILNTLDPLGKFDGKDEEGFLVGYSVNSKAFRIFNTKTRKVEENLHVNFLENKPNVAGQGPNWLFDIDSLTNSMNYQLVTAGNQTNKNAGPQETNGNTSLKKNVDTGQTEEENVSTQQYIMFPLWSSISSSYKSSDDKAKDYKVDDDACRKTVQEPSSEYDQALKNVLDKIMYQEKEATEQSDVVRKEFEAQTFSHVEPSSGPSFVPFGGSFPIDFANLPHDPLIPELEDTAEIQSNGIFCNAYDDHDLETLNTPYADQSVGAEADFNNMESSTVSAVQTKGMTKKNSGEHAMIRYIQKQRRTNHKDFQNCLFACFLSQHEPIKISQALDDESWVEAMQEELLQFDSKGYKQEEGIDYDEVFATVARVEEIRLFFAVASFMNFPVYQMDVKSAFLYDTIEEEQKEDGIFISQDKYVGEILKKFRFSSLRTASTPMETNKALTKDEDGEDVDVYLYRFQVQPKDSPLILEAFLESDYAGASLDRKSTTGGCQFLGSRLISWEWLTQLLKLNTLLLLTAMDKHHFIRDSFEKRLVEMVKIHIDHNVADLLTKAFDVGDEAVHKELGDIMERAATTASSLKA
ncbi:ribonuclease H-like domain-containing protein [Tanacetum coccineum]